MDDDQDLNVMVDGIFIKYEEEWSLLLRHLCMLALE